MEYEGYMLVSLCFIAHYLGATIFTDTGMVEIVR